MRHPVACAFTGAVLVLTLLPGCTNFFRDRSQAYAQAGSTPPLVLPDTPTRPIKPLNPIPAVSQPYVSTGKSFEPPFPPSLQQAKTADLPVLANLPGRSVVKMGTDGNGVPEIRVIGPRERIWDELGRALRNAQIKIRDRNQSLGIVDITIDKQDYQLRMVRATEAFVITVQRNDETLAPIAVSRTLLTSLQARWP